VLGWKKWARTRSPWLFHAHCGGCNGCDIEVAAALTPRYDVERIGIVLTNNPRYADIMVVTGIVPKAMVPVIKRIYNQMTEPKGVVAVGACATTGGVFLRDDDNPTYTFGGPVDKIIPVDVYVPGCPPKPEAIIVGIAQCIQKALAKD